jgi:hypothetical protein
MQPGRKTKLHPSPEQGGNSNYLISLCQLSEGHAKELIETQKVSNPMFALIPENAFVEFVSWEKAH